MLSSGLREINISKELLTQMFKLDWVFYRMPMGNMIVLKIVSKLP